MKVTFHYPERCTGRPFESMFLWESPRGLTGSEGSFFRYAIELGMLGHEVTVFGAFDQLVTKTCGVVLKQEQCLSTETPGDVTVSWMASEKNPHWMGLDAPFRILNVQCNDFVGPLGWEGYTNLVCPLSHAHAKHMLPQSSAHPTRYRVMPNGVDLNEFAPGVKQRGKVVFASSHDRGLHHLLGIWPEVKRLVPWATLDVFYDTTGMQRFAEMPEQTGWIEELRRRAIYSLEGLARLERLDVKCHGSVSRVRIQQELATAEALAYPCDPVRAMVETFGVTVLEAMAAGCVPVLCLSDAFAELWGPHCPAVPAPYDGAQYAKLLAGVLTRDAEREGDARDCRKAAEAYSWPVLGKRMSEFLESRGERGFERPFSQ